MSRYADQDRWDEEVRQETRCLLIEALLVAINKISCDRDDCQENIEEGGEHRARCSHTGILKAIRDIAGDKP